MTKGSDLITYVSAKLKSQGVMPYDHHIVMYINNMEEKEVEKFLLTTKKK